jgi:hypothetical protein
VLFGGYRLYRAFIFAQAAVDAQLGIDLVSFFPFADGVLWTHFGARPTRNAFIGIDYVRHRFLLESELGVYDFR